MNKWDDDAYRYATPSGDGVFVIILTIVLAVAGLLWLLFLR